MRMSRRDFFRAGGAGVAATAALAGTAQTAPVKARFALPRSGFRIVVVGVGGGGGAVVNRMMKRPLPGVEHVWVHTDARAMERQAADVKLPIGPRAAHGLGTGGRPDRGRRAAEESIRAVRRMLADADLVFVTGGMGGGTVTGAVPIIARSAREAGALTVAVVAEPFLFEGCRRGRQAQDGILDLSASADTTIVVPGDQAVQVLGEPPVSFREAFAVLDATMVAVLRAVIGMVAVPGLIEVDFSDIRWVMQNRGPGAAGIGVGGGPDRCVKAVESAFRTLGAAEAHTGSRPAGPMLVNVAGGDVDLWEVEDMMAFIYDRLAAETVAVVGDTPDPGLGSEARVTLIATRMRERITRGTGIRSPFKRFTEEARTIVIRAKDQAKSRNHMEIDDRHYLLALTEREDNAAAFILQCLGWDCAKIRDAVEKRTPSAVRVGTPVEPVDMPFSESAKKFLERSGEEAARLDSDWIGCEHFLLSLLSEEGKETVSGGILRGFGVTFRRVSGKAGPGQVGNPAADPRRPRVRRARI